MKNQKGQTKTTVIQQLTQNSTYLPESALRKQVESDLEKLSLSTLYGLQTIIALRIKDAQNGGGK